MKNLSGKKVVGVNGRGCAGMRGTAHGKTVKHCGEFYIQVKWEPQWSRFDGWVNRESLKVNE